jgi:hypothetical protein
MARKLTKESGFEFKRNKGSGKYPWNEWLDGDTWELVHGEDFQPDIPYFAQMCYGAATKRGMKCRTKREGDTLTIQAYIPDGTA